MDRNGKFKIYEELILYYFYKHGTDRIFSKENTMNEMLKWDKGRFLTYEDIQKTRIRPKKFSNFEIKNSSFHDVRRKLVERGLIENGLNNLNATTTFSKRSHEFSPGFVGSACWSPINFFS